MDVHIYSIIMNTIQSIQEINIAELYKRVIEKLLVKSDFTE